MLGAPVAVGEVLGLPCSGPAALVCDVAGLAAPVGAVEELPADGARCGSSMLVACPGRCRVIVISTGGVLRGGTMTITDPRSPSDVDEALGW